MWELLSIALEGMQPTLRHVPPREPRFSMQAVWVGLSPRLPAQVLNYLETELSSLYSGHVSTGTWSHEQRSLETEKRVYRRR